MNVTCLRSSRPPASSKELCPSRCLNPAEVKRAVHQFLQPPRSYFFNVTVSIKTGLGNCFWITLSNKKCAKKNQKALINIVNKNLFTGHGICVYSHLSHSWLEVGWTLVPDPSSTDPWIPRNPQLLLHLGTI